MRSRPALLTLAVAALVALPAAALASAGPRQVWVTDCFKSAYKPKSITIACGDASNILVKLTWSSWSRTKAVGSGKDAVNMCTPNCAAGHFTYHRVTATLSKPIHCSGRKHRVFNRLTLKFKGQSGPNGTQKVILGCPLKQ
jgi:hypothetical protein